MSHTNYQNQGTNEFHRNAPANEQVIDSILIREVIAEIRKQVE